MTKREMTRKLLGTFGLAAALTLVGSPVAGAQEPAAAAPTRGGDEVVEHDFADADLVRGDLVRPEGETLFVRQGRTFRSLIRPRSTFVPELTKSVENL
ncbi:MAG TPA: hypothetical protein RMG45_20450 [Polyangiaceae bacterium LLY-WYZ-15_(1-7)]|nr:hypothetical protein [Polyangiaceae bacterium LLY-WYZ-15_(1-7)]HJL48241.1 hypothetical protein [Polyangiaceae bacterium LLY-WYZ-15_(1-7)]